MVRHDSFFSFLRSASEKTKTEMKIKYRGSGS